MQIGKSRENYQLANTFQKVYSLTVGNGNLLINGNFESWAAGTSAAPDGWALEGASATVARESSVIKLGTYSVKLTRVGTDCAVRQSNIYTAKGITYWRGKTVTVGCWVYATVANRARITILDGIDAGSSSYHTGDSTWQWLTSTYVINVSATAFTIDCQVNTGDTSAYFDGAILVEGSSIPTGMNVDLDSYDKTSILISGLRGNFIINGAFGTWTAGTSSAPDGWQTFGAGVGVARESSTIKIGTYSMKLTRSGADCGLLSVLTTYDTSRFQGKVMTFGCWVYATVPNRACLILYNAGVSGTGSSYHTGDGTWQWLTVTHTMESTGIVQPAPSCEIRGGDTTAYFSGGILVEGTTVPQPTSINDGYWLAGNTDEVYMLRCKYVNGYDGAVNYAFLLNNDAGATYGYQLFYGSNTSKGAARGTYTGGNYTSYASDLNEVSYDNTTLYVKSGYVRTALTQIVYPINGTTISNIKIQGTSWNNTADEISQIKILADQITGIGVGSQIDLYKLVRST